tara:strand:+ start:24110 stop:24295 length:186 start_codon:yes stop_codon:yes gene_type:complete
MSKKKTYIVKEYAVITFSVEAESRDEVQQMIEDSDEWVSNPMLSVGWDTKKVTVVCKGESE